LTLAINFYIRRIMEKKGAVAALAALAQNNRLDVFRLLVQAGPKGMPAGAVAQVLGLAPNTLTFHFDRLRQAGLVSVRRESRSMIYAARHETIRVLLDFLTENCCAGAPAASPPAHSPTANVHAKGRQPHDGFGRHARSLPEGKVGSRARHNVLRAKDRPS
jgi:ArsR family transcriptional regulator